jgi:hypothetical protein
MQYFVMNNGDLGHLRVQVKPNPCDRIGEVFVGADQITQQQ